MMRMPQQTIISPGQRVMRALDVLLGQDASLIRMHSMQVKLNEMTMEVNKLHDQLNEQIKLMRKIHEMTGNKP